MNHSFRLNPSLLLVLLMFSSSVLRAQRDSFRIIGYVPNWIDVSLFTQNFDFKQVTHLNYAFQNPDASGNLVETNSGLTALVAKSHANNVKVLVSIGGGSAADGPVKDNFQNLISTAEKRAGFIHKIVVYLDKYQLDGLDVDEEGPAINSDYEAFIIQLADSLKPKGKLLTTAVGWGSEKIRNSTLPYFDYVTIMAYDYTGNWDQSRPGQHSSYLYAEKLINDWIARGVKKENLCLGLPFYGYGFYKSPGSYSYDKILTNFPDAWVKDQVGDTIYYNGKNTIWKKTKLALSETSGVMIWELSQDAKGDNSLLKLINQTVDSLKVSSVPITDKNHEFKIYPNPVKNQLVIDNLSAGKPVRVEIFNMNGCLMKSQNFRSPEGKIRIRIAALDSGGYVCRITSSEGIYSRQFLKE
ncbi:MAG: T9SS type A sorting domain-containing protein [Prolixibacteraceae bacterium]|nr:T9SS type A sorting domain-containing protein [Prolixibacteraceae bacterium]